MTVRNVYETNVYILMVLLVKSRFNRRHFRLSPLYATYVNPYFNV